MKISDKSIENPLIVGVLLLLVLIMGTVGIMLTPKELFPEIKIPVLFVTVIYPGATPKEIESQVSQKIEKKIKTLDDVKEIVSTSSQGIASIAVEFIIGSDIDDKVNKVNAALGEITDFPDDAEDPIISKVDFTKIPFMTLSLFSNRYDYLTLTEIAKDIREQIETINGVDGVNIYGGIQREISVRFQGDKMSGKNVSIPEIIQFFQNDNLNFPAGRLDDGENLIPITFKSRFTNVRDIKESEIRASATGEKIKLKDIATVMDTTAKQTSYSRFNGVPSITLGILRESGKNQIDLSKACKDKIQSIKDQGVVPRDATLAINLDTTDMQISNLNSLSFTAAFGILVVVITLMIGLGLRNALIAGMGIPFAFLVAIAYLYYTGDSLNNLSQFGLIIVSGMVVDGAIVLVENIYRHREHGAGAIEAAKVGTHEVGGSIISSVLTTIAAFSPLLFMSGIMGQFMSRIPITIIVALTASMVFDHIFVPMLASKFIKPRRIKKMDDDFHKNGFHPLAWIFNEILNIYRRIIRVAIKYSFLTILISFFGGLILLVLMFSRIGVEFFPQSDLSKLTINVSMPVGTPIDETDGVVRQVEHFISEYRWDYDKEPNAKYDKTHYTTYFIKQYVANVGSVGALAREGQNAATNTASLELELVSDTQRSLGLRDIIAFLRNKTDKIAGAKITYAFQSGGPPTGDPINILVTGDDLNRLKSISKKIQSLIKNVKDAVEIKDDYGKGIPELSSTIDRTASLLYGLSPNVIASTLAIAYNSLVPSEYKFKDENIDIRVEIADSYQNVKDLENLSVISPVSRKAVLLKSLTDINLEPSYSVVNRQDNLRSITISGKVDERKNVTTITVFQDVRKIVDEYFKANPLPTGYSYRYAGENDDRDQSFSDLGYSMLVAIALIYIILVIQFRSLIQPIAIISTIFLAVFGAVFGLFISGTKVGMMPGFGIVALTGIVVNDAIVLISYINHLRRNEGFSRNEAIFLAGERRLRPILLTTVTTMAGLMPMIFFSSGSSTFLVPLGITIVSGLGVATGLLLVLVPVVYVLIEKFFNFMQHFLKSLFDVKPKLERIRGLFRPNVRPKQES